MPQPGPLPFRLRVPGSDTVGIDGVHSVSYRVEGLLHLADLMLTLEWTGTQTTDRVTLGRVGTDTEDLPLEWVELPVDWILEARVRGGWWRPYLELRARQLDAFDDVPTARGPTLKLRVRRRDRARAREMALAIEVARADAALAEAEGHPRLGGA